MLELMVRNGWRATDKIGDADLVILNACGLTQYSEECSIHLAKSIQHSKKPDARLIVCGCLAKINPSRLKEVYDGPMFGSDEDEALGRIFDFPVNGDHPPANYLIPYTHGSAGWSSRLRNISQIMDPYSLMWLPYAKDFVRCAGENNIIGPNVSYIKVASGCLNNCTYCGVKLSRGQLKSKPVRQIVDELKSGLELGFNDFALIGSDLGCYGRDQGGDLVQMLRELTGIPGKFSIRIRNVHPRFMIEMLPGLADVFASGRISFMISAAQSGSNRIIDLMGRGYCIEDYITAVNTLKKSSPTFRLRTQLMVGFPGETDDEFGETLALLDRVAFDFVETYGFSPRPGTPAASLPGRVSPHTITKRLFHLNKKILHQLRGRSAQAA